MNASAAEKADRSVRTMSQEDKIGQLMCIGLEGTTFDESQKELVRKYRVGGIVLDNDNMESKEQVRAFHKRHTRHCEYVEPHDAVHRHESRTHAVQT